MSRIAWQGFALAVLSLALPLGASAQDAAAVLRPTADALNIGRIDGLRLVASGSGYEERPEAEQRAQPGPKLTAAAPQPLGAPTGPAEAVRPGQAPRQPPAESAGRSDTVDPSSPMYVPPPPPRARRPFRIVSHVENLDLAEESLRIERVSAESTSPDAERQQPATTTIDADSDWAERHRYWLTPHGFVAGALARDASVGTQAIDGIEYRVVTFTADGAHEVRGYVGPDDRLVRIRTTVVAADGRTTDVVESFLDWEEQANLAFPSVLIRKENGALAEVLVVQEVDAATSG